MRRPRRIPRRRDPAIAAQEVAWWPDADVARLAAVTDELLARGVPRPVAAHRAYLRVRRERRGRAA